MKKITKLTTCLATVFMLCSCAEPIIGETGPQGPIGEPGIPGEPGEPGRGIQSINKTSTKDNIDTYTISYTDGTTSEFIVVNGLNGEQGIQGLPGTNGHTPEIKIDSNGHWIIDGVDTNIKAQGDKGEQGEPGINGQTPYIKDGNWWIGDKDTGVKAEGTDGVDGQDGKPGANGSNGTDGQTPYIKDGNWWIGDKDTGVKAEGTDGVDGQDGQNGLSAYEIYKKYHNYEGSEEQWLDDLISGRLNAGLKHRVKFVTNCDTELPDVYVDDLSYLQEPDPLFKEGYEFMGWTYNGQPWNFEEYVVSYSLLLTANWKHVYDVSNLKLIHEEHVKHVADPSYVNAFQNKVVKVTGTVTGYYNNNLFIREKIDNHFYALKIYTGHNYLSNEIKTPGAYISVVGKFDDNATYGPEILDIYPLTDDANIVGATRVLITADKNTGEHKNVTYDYSASTLNSLIMNNSDDLDELLLANITITEGVYVESNERFNDYSDLLTIGIKNNQGIINRLSFKLYVYGNCSDLVGTTIKLNGIFSTLNTIEGTIRIINVYSSNDIEVISNNQTDWSNEDKALQVSVLKKEFPFFSKTVGTWTSTGNRLTYKARLYKNSKQDFLNALGRLNAVDITGETSDVLNVKNYFVPLENKLNHEGWLITYNYTYTRDLVFNISYYIDSTTYNVDMINEYVYARFLGHIVLPAPSVSVNKVKMIDLPNKNSPTGIAIYVANNDLTTAISSFITDLALLNNEQVKNIESPDYLHCLAIYNSYVLGINTIDSGDGLYSAIVLTMFTIK